MNKIEFFTTLGCPHCLKMDFVVLLKNLSLPIQDEIDVVWDDVGDPKMNKLFQTFGNLVPLPVLIKDDKGIREAIKGVYGNPYEKFTYNFEDNFKLIDSLL